MVEASRQENDVMEEYVRTCINLNVNNVNLLSPHNLSVRKGKKKNSVFVKALYYDLTVCACPHSCLVTSRRETRDKISHERAHHPSFELDVCSHSLLLSSNLIVVCG